MATTVIITQWGESISVHPNYYTKPRGQNPSEYWHFSVNVKRYRYKNAQPLIRYNAEITAKRIPGAITIGGARTDISHPSTPKMLEEIVIFRSNRSHRGGGDVLGVADEAHTILQSLLQAIDNGVPSWDVRELL